VGTTLSGLRPGPVGALWAVPPEGGTAA
jgi:hypothetical protein